MELFSKSKEIKKTKKMEPSERQPARIYRQLQLIEININGNYALNLN